MNKFRICVVPVDKIFGVIRMINDIIRNGRGVLGDYTFEQNNIGNGNCELLLVSKAQNTEETRSYMIELFNTIQSLSTFHERKQEKC